MCGDIEPDLIALGRTSFCVVSLVARTARGRDAIRKAGWESARDPSTGVFLPQDPTVLFQVHSARPFSFTIPCIVLLLVVYQIDGVGGGYTAVTPQSTNRLVVATCRVIDVVTRAFRVDAVQKTAPTARAYLFAEVVAVGISGACASTYGTDRCAVAVATLAPAGAMEF